MPWPRILAEGVAIVVSILLAFGIQAWWEGRQERLEAQSRLAAVRAELSEARTGFLAHLQALNSQDSLAVLILGEVADYSGSSTRMDSLLWRLGPPPSYAPPMAAFEDATNAGSLSLISSDQLRRALAEYRRLVQDDAREQEVARARFDVSMVPLWNEYVSTRDHFDVAKGYWAGQVPELPPVPFESDYPGLLQDRRFSSEIVGRTFLSSRIRQRHGRVMQAIDELVELIDSF